MGTAIAAVLVGAAGAGFGWVLWHAWSDVRRILTE